jgi:hypothetical protein
MSYLFCVCLIRVPCVIFVIHLITLYMCEFDMIVYYRIIEHVIHPLIFVLCYLMYVKLQFREYLQVKS